MATVPNFVVVRSGGGVPAVTSVGGSLQPIHEIPQGTYDGVNKVFTLSHAPNPQNWVIAVVDGVLQSAFPNRDKTRAAEISVSGATLTFTYAPLASDNVEVYYFVGKPGSAGFSGKARFFGAPTTSGTDSSGFAKATGQFIPTAGTSGDAGVFFSNQFGEPGPGDTLVIGSVTYTWVTAINNAVANQMLIPSFSTFGSFFWYDALIAAINSGGDGTRSSSATVANPDVSAGVIQYFPGSGGQFSLTTKPGAPDSPIALSVTSSGNFAMAVFVGNTTSYTQTLYISSTAGGGAMQPGDTITINGRTYTFVSSLTGANQILAAPPSGYSLAEMLANTINAGLGAGLFYSTGTSVNTDVSASAQVANQTVTITAKSGGAIGNGISISTSSSGRFIWSSSTLSGGTGGGTGASTDLLDWGNDPSWNITGDLSIGVWVKFPSDAHNNGVIIEFGQNGSSNPVNTNYILMSYGSTGGPWDIHYYHDYASGFNISESHVFATKIPNDTWRYLFLVRDDTALTVSLYMASVGSSALTLVETWSYTNHPDGGGDPTNRMTLGFQHGGTGGAGEATLIGAVEEHYVWNRKLTTDEGFAAMQRNGPIDAMVLGCFMGDDPEIDISGTGASGTVTGTTLVPGHG